MKYYCKFDSNGKMTASIADFQVSSFGGIDKLTTDGYIAITDADHAYYIGNQGTGKNGTGYVRGSDGSPTDADLVVITLVQAQTTALSAVDSAASAAYTAGFTSSANGTAMIYDSDSFTQTEIQTTAALAAASPTNFTAQFPNGFPIRAKASTTAAKQIIYLTATQLITLATDWVTRYKAIKAQVWALQTAINACTTITAVEAITISIT